MIDTPENFRKDDKDMKNTYIVPELTVSYILEEDILTVSLIDEAFGVDIDCSDW